MKFGLLSMCKPATALLPAKVKKASGGRLLPGRISAVRFSLLFAPAWLALTSSPAEAQTAKPNILLILADDMGFSDIGCYGSEIQTPNLDALAQRGIRFSNFYNNSVCQPSRSSIMKGAYVQQPASGALGNDLGARLKENGYATLFVGKNHSSGATTASYRMRYTMDGGAENHFNPGVQRVGETQIPAHRFTQVSNITPVYDWTIDNVGVNVIDGIYKFPTNHYSTVTFANKGIEYLDTQVATNEPFFLYLSFTAPHYPIHALPEDKAAYTNVYDIGWDTIRTRRFARQKKLGLFADNVALSPAVPGQKDWAGLSADAKADYADRMQTHAAMIHRIDIEVGRVLAKIESMGRLDNTIIMFLSDNGADNSDASYTTDTNATRPDTTSQTSYVLIGTEWANVADTPFRLHKNTVYEGGTHTSCILAWPGLLPASRQGEWNPTLAHVMDILPTFLEAANITLPSNIEGKSLKPVVQTGTRTGGAAHAYLAGQYSETLTLRQGDYKIVSFEGRNWGLYNLATDPTEIHDLSANPAYATTLAALVASYDDWATKGGTTVRIWANSNQGQLGSYDGGPAVVGAKPVPGNGGAITMSGNNITFTAATDAESPQSALEYSAFYSYRNDLTTVDDVLAWAIPISSGWVLNTTSLGGIQYKPIAGGQTVYPYVLVADPQKNRAVYGPGTYTVPVSGNIPVPGKITAITPVEPSSVTVTWTQGTDAQDATLSYALITSDQNNIDTVRKALTYGNFVTPFTLGLTTATAFNVPRGTNYFAVLVRDTDRNIVITPLDSAVSSSSAKLTIGACSTYADYVARRGSPSGLTDPSGDANGNGLRNIVEYSLGADPLASGASPTITALEGTPGDRRLVFSADRDRQDIRYRVVANSSLNFIGDRTVLFDSGTTPWSFNAAGKAVVPDPGAFSRRYIRLEVENLRP
ncbi:MAG: sulfatase-like hydrolase/transferase [Kiritimatiellaceae bacterium]|nr:sulfatase-like hydrolase/transferase [Kiritimatiellaceae bacterium]